MQGPPFDAPGGWDNDAQTPAVPGHLLCSYCATPATLRGVPGGGTRDWVADISLGLWRGGEGVQIGRGGGGGASSTTSFTGKIKHSRSKPPLGICEYSPDTRWVTCSTRLPRSPDGIRVCLPGRVRVTELVEPVLVL